MIKQIQVLTIITILFLTLCASSMTPIQVHNTLPNLTKPKYISQAQANEDVKK